MADPTFATWLALEDGRPLAYLRFGPASEEAARIIRDPGTTSITGAFTLPGARGQGVGAALLNRGLAWARDQGYARCAVDFEPMNTLSARFWTRHFHLVSLASLRRIDSRVAWAATDRDTEDM